MVTVIVRPVAGAIVIAMHSQNFILMELDADSFTGFPRKIILLIVLVKTFTSW